MTGVDAGAPANIGVGGRTSSHALCADAPISFPSVLRSIIFRARLGMNALRMKTSGNRRQCTRREVTVAIAPDQVTVLILF